MRSSFLVAAMTLSAVGSVVVGQGAKSAATPPPKPVDAIPADAPMFARQGTWFGAGLGAGSTSLHCQICNNDEAGGTRGTSGYVRVGTTINGRFLLGAELNGWMRSAESGRQRVVSLTGNGYWYPNPRHGYYFKGGLGVSRYKSSVTDQNNQEVSTGIATGGLTGQVGAGYEVRVNPKMSFVPFLNVIGTARGTLFTERTDDTSFERNRLPNRANVLFLQLGMGLTWH